MGVNKVFLLGNLTADPQIRKFPDGNKIATVSIATNESYKKDGNVIEHTEFHQLVIRGGHVAVAEAYLRKGSKLHIEGVLRHRSYQAQDNSVRYITEVYVIKMEMLTPKPQHPETTPPPDDEDLPF